ncbi:Uncharacterised protein [Raoultella terrigena]|uniref:Uncharacterized protein n=1 Tax=Raoultella terrigena TaxID=577 RepID=A0A4U9CR34_RAOTE|nr:Uncharacterised protein [Raoultella terrigena]
MREQQRPEAQLNANQHKQHHREIAITISGDIITTNSIPLTKGYREAVAVERNGGQRTDQVAKVADSTAW